MLASLVTVGLTFIPEEYSEILAHGVAALLPPKKASDSQGSPGASTPSAVPPRGSAPSSTPSHNSSAPSNKTKPKGTGVAPGSEDYDRAQMTGNLLVSALQAGVVSADMVRQFQAAAKIPVDGDYGPITAGALMYFTGETILPKTGPAKIVPYTA